MPIRKTSKGWMWGSKGPFKTKAKAAEVSRAAHASGYGKKKGSRKRSVKQAARTGKISRRMVKSAVKKAKSKGPRCN